MPSLQTRGWYQFSQISAILQITFPQLLSNPQPTLLGLSKPSFYVWMLGTLLKQTTNKGG